jgi:polysaccharide deacetylase family protein (PEP-CTERM system associated)
VLDPGRILPVLRALGPAPRRASERLNALTVDVEEYFTVQNLDGVVSREAWPAQPLRSDAQTRRLLDLFEAHGVRATFFVLGWVGERLPSLVREIHARGHEVAAHSYWHRLVFEQTPAEFREDLRRVRDLLQDLTGARVRGYRAPTYSVTRASLWAHEILAEEGFDYSSSIFPVVHDRYGIPGWPRFPRVVRAAGRDLLEFPLTTFPLGRRNLPVAGGGYLRLAPARGVALALAHVNEQEGQPAIVYLHPWEIDPGIPRFRQGLLRDARGYVGLDGMLGKLELLLRAFRFGTVAEVLGLDDPAGPRWPRLEPGEVPAP